MNKYILILLLYFLNINSSFAEIIDHQFWSNLNLTKKLNSSYSFYGEIQPRYIDHYQNLGTTLHRFALGYAINQESSLWAGYGYIWWENPKEYHEYRPYLQWLNSKKYEETSLINRTRIESRKIKNNQDDSYRIRHLVRYLTPINLQELYISIWDEIFYNLNQISKQSFGPKQGLDQNRFFIGIAKKFGDRASHLIEVGYLNQEIQKDGENSVNHVLALQLAFTF